MSSWWSKQFEKMGAPPIQQQPTYQQPVAPMSPQDALRATQGRFSQQQQTQEGHGTYEDILNSNINGYQPDPRKYGNLQDTSVDSHCPMCGSPNFFSRRGALRSGSKSPAPHCFDCGYNGEAVAWQEAAPIDSKTPVNQARGQSGRNLDYSTPIAHIK